MAGNRVRPTRARAGQRQGRPHAFRPARAPRSPRQSSRTPRAERLDGLDCRASRSVTHASQTRHSPAPAPEHSFGPRSPRGSQAERRGHRTAPRRVPIQRRFAHIATSRPHRSRPVAEDRPHHADPASHDARRINLLQFLTAGCRPVHTPAAAPGRNEEPSDPPRPTGASPRARFRPTASRSPLTCCRFRCRSLVQISPSVDGRHDSRLGRPGSTVSEGEAGGYRRATSSGLRQDGRVSVLSVVFRSSPQQLSSPRRQNATTQACTSQITMREHLPRQESGARGATSYFPFFDRLLVLLRLLVPSPSQILLRLHPRRPA